jgi:hypothetical protein
VSVPPDAAKIVIRYGDTTVEFNPLTKLLHDAVDSIPTALSTTQNNGVKPFTTRSTPWKTC